MTPSFIDKEFEFHVVHHHSAGHSDHPSPRQCELRRSWVNPLRMPRSSPSAGKLWRGIGRGRIGHHPDRGIGNHAFGDTDRHRELHQRDHDLLEVGVAHGTYRSQCRVPDHLHPTRRKRRSLVARCRRPDPPGPAPFVSPTPWSRIHADVAQRPRGWTSHSTVISTVDRARNRLLLAATNPASPAPPSTIGSPGGRPGLLVGTGTTGLAYGYLGVGLDVYGNYREAPSSTGPAARTRRGWGLPRSFQARLRSGSRKRNHRLLPVDQHRANSGAPR